MMKPAKRMVSLIPNQQKRAGFEHAPTFIFIHQETKGTVWGNPNCHFCGVSEGFPGTAALVYRFPHDNFALQVQPSRETKSIDWQLRLRLGQAVSDEQAE